MYSCCYFGCWCVSVPVYCPKQAVPWWLAAIVAVVFLDCDSICVGQQTRCVPAFLLLPAAEWALTSNSYKCVSWEEMTFFQCPVFCDEPMLLLFGPFVLLVVFFQSCLDEEGLNHGMFLQAVGSLTMAVAVVLFPLLSVFQDERTGPRSAARPVQSLVSDFLQHLQPFHFLLQPLTHTCNFKQMVFCLNLLSCPSLSWGTLNLGFWFCFAFNVS